MKEEIKLLMDIFNKDIRDFSNNSPNKDELVKKIPALFRRWYYSAQVSDSTLSPAYLTGWLCDSGKSADTTLGLESFENGTTTLKPLSYSLWHHPFLEDFTFVLKKLEDMGGLDFEDENGSGYYKALSPFLAVKEPFYLEVLIALALELSLLIPDEEHCRYIPAQGREAFFAQNKQQQLFCCIHAAMDRVTELFNSFLPNEEGVVLTRPYLQNFLTQPKTYGQVFFDLYVKAVTDPEAWPATMLKSTNHPSDFLRIQGKMVHRNTFFFGLLMDKYIYTVFGQYLRLINPVYLRPIDLKAELASAGEPYFFCDDISPTLYEAPDFHYLTELGLDIFMEKLDKNNFYKISSQLAYELFLEIVQENEKQKALRKRLEDEKPLHTYVSLKAIAPNDQYWFICDFLPETLLKEVYEVLSAGFFVSRTYEFRFEKDGRPLSQAMRLQDPALQPGSHFTLKLQDLTLSIQILSVSKKKKPDYTIVEVSPAFLQPISVDEMNKDFLVATPKN